MILKGAIGLALLFALLLAAACGGGGSPGARLVVNGSGDSVERDGLLTLREAVLLATGELSPAELDPAEAAQVEGEPGPQSADVILFARPFLGEGAIRLSESLPPLSTGEDTIDGSGAGGVVIDGGDHSFPCLKLASSDNAVLGLQLMNCRTGILVLEQATGNRVGGREPGQRNVISGNVVGIELRGRANVIRGNLIGTDVSGSQGLGNEFEGIWITPRGRENVIGGPRPGEGNVISGNKLFGISIDGAVGNVVQGNLIGLDLSGARGLGNRYGVILQAGARDNLIGGHSAGEGNVISDNNTGVILRDSATSGNVIRGNYFGTDATGKVEVPNSVDIWEREGTGENTVEANRLREQRLSP